MKKIKKQATIDKQAAVGYSGTMKEKTIKMPNSFGKEIEVTKKEWTARWQDCTVKSLRGFFLEDEYFKLQNRIKELAEKQFDKNYGINN